MHQQVALLCSLLLSCGPGGVLGIFQLLPGLRGSLFSERRLQQDPTCQHACKHPAGVPHAPCMPLTEVESEHSAHEVVTSTTRLRYSCGRMSMVASNTLGGECLTDAAFTLHQ
jgi:hypothetical protein